ncbi:hypothetical protein [Burkholderia diffusa]|uniref:hypothetical protein n=1 Tax=Burkholderia diffusa TaxID=488732 RepID=UPI002AB2D60D|nr:hypothetical protein [Burkholderia diffusa]
MKLRSSILSCIAFAAVSSVPVSATAAIDLNPKEVTVEKDSTSVQLINNGDRVEYVSVSLSRLLNPGMPLNSERLEPVGEVTQPSLYAFPFRVTLAPGQTKTITLKPLRPVETETVYRLNVKPVIKLLGAEDRKTTANVVVNLGFSALVRQLPSQVREGLAVTCDASGARFSVTGNVRYRVEGVKVNDAIVDSFNVYPGVPIHVPGERVDIPGHPACRR